MPSETAYIGIGSNLGDSVDFVQQAILCLSNMQLSQLEKRSSLYRSEPLGDYPQDDYINAVHGFLVSLKHDGTIWSD